MGEVTNFKRIFYLSFLIYLLIAIVGYRYLVKPIVEKNHEIKFVQSQGFDTDNAPSLLEQKRLKLRHLDKQLFKFDLEKDVFSDITSFCDEHHLAIEYNEPTEDLLGDFLISTNEITLQGEFKPIVQLINLIEQELGWVDQCDFNKEEKRSGRKTIDILQCHIRFKNMKAK